MHRVSLSLLLIALTASLFMSTGESDAQQPPGEPGDYYWQFANQGILADSRVQHAFVLLVDPEAVTANAGVEGSLLYGDAGVAEFTSSVGQEEATLLLAAAGFADPGTDLLHVRACRFWTLPGTDGEAERPAVAQALGDEIARVLEGLGVDAETCEPASSSIEADIFVWQFRQDLEVPAGEPGLDADTFLTPNVELPGRVPGGTGGDVSPPVVGTGGLLRPGAR